ncbi:hypothetical protein LZ519_10730 [Sphingomonas sp. RG327]|uniref:Uncharacterized protein n=1 Tax=Sphingomonas anseongensis TaxID=2908207 RepID=A0ABT0RHM8_9SPHN|nr:hypothetical protein [Sphingomonas anseongensis]MCL6679784.1 hypothetical protein [Sphingomonas anseongensis]
MPVLLLTALLAIPASAASLPARDMPSYKPTPREPQGLCPKTAAQVAAERVKRGGSAKLHKLTDLPPANAYIAVFRHDSNGCEAPIVVKYGLGRQ